MKIFSYLLIALILLCHAASAATLHTRAAESRSEAPRHLLYTFDLGQPGRVHIRLETSSPATGMEMLELPSQWAEVRELEHGILDLKITGESVALEPTGRPSRLTLRAKPGTTIQLDYDLVEDWTGPFLLRERHHVVLRPQLMTFNGSNALVAPRMDATAPVQVRFSFRNLPAGRTLVTSFGTAPEQSMSGVWSQVANALFTAASFRMRQLTVQGSPVLLAVTGAWSFSDHELALKVHEILAAERTFWGDAPPAWYAVVLAPLEGGSAGGGGTAFTHAFSLYLAPGEGFGSETASLFAHEAFHAWNPSHLGLVPDLQPVAWFAEGFTTFYQDLMLERSGLIDHGQLLGRRNTLLREYFLSLQASPHGGPPDLENSLDADEIRLREPYLRGAMLAIWLARQIHLGSRGSLSLDDMMRTLEAENTQPLTNDRLFATAARFVDTATAARLRSLVETHSEVPLLPGSLGACTVFRSVQAWTFDLGLPVSQLKRDTILSDVDPASTAFRAGLRDGQTLLGWSLWNGDPERPVVLNVRDRDGGLDRLEYLPRGRQVDIPQAEPVAHCTQEPGSSPPEQSPPEQSP